ncbi:MAG: helix-turn-helix transcriptional regulator [Sedimentisphaerales bacterium]|nr:helix-turn-helix transcriptional regulator [Sedimentisphaerales bacterium]
MSNRKSKLDTCICSGKSLDRMLRPAVLTILCDQTQGLHGYAIEKELQTFKFFRNQPPDYTGLYRLLKRMETERLLSSTESDSQAGPSKRIYRPTDRGRNCLLRWLDSLVEYQEMLDDLLTSAKRTMEVDL